MSDHLAGPSSPEISIDGSDGGLRPTLVRSGEATVFLAAVGDDGHIGRRSPFVTVQAPALLAMDAAPTGWRWVMGPGLGSAIEEATLDSDERLIRRAVAQTVETVGSLLQPAATPPADRVVHLGDEPSLVPAGHGAIVEAAAWVQPVTGAVALADVAVPQAGAPLPRRVAVYGEDESMVVTRPLEDVEIPQLLAGIEWLFSVGAGIVLAAGVERQRREAKVAEASEHQAWEAQSRAVELLAEQLRPRPEPAIPAGGDPLIACLARVLASKGLELRVPRGGLDGKEGTEAVRALATASRVYTRRVTLIGNWWTGADEAVLGYRPDGAPVALLPAGGGMVCVEADGRASPVNERLAGGLLDTGFVFNKPLLEPEVDERTSVQTAVAGRRGVLAAYVSWATLLALSGLAVPFAAGVVFDQIVPHADRARLWYLLATLVLVAIATLPLQLALTSAQTRFETGASLDIQRGIWGRVLASPVTLVRRVGAGDLAMRLSGLEAARDPIQASVLAVLPALLSGLLAGIVLFTYQQALAALVLLGGLLILGLGLFLARAAAREQRELDAATGAVNGFLFQVLVAIPKLRVAEAEARAFLAWADRFRFAAGQRLMRAASRQILLTSMVPTIGSVLLFGSVAIVGPRGIGVDVFVAFQTTFNLFLTGVSSTVGAAGTTLSLRPNLERAIELTRERPESDADRGEQGRLRGEVALAGVTFRYLPTTHPVLDELAFRVEPSEMVAITGYSGSGKSTIIRLLLGFERPEQGSVLFDGQDLSSLDVAAVRRQLGVVLQDGQLIPGTVRDNLAGVASLSDDEAWELAEVVALADEIRAMPMRMDTLVALNGGAFSGGQRQRLVIARALAPRPRILLLDEATSSLDNIAQRVITENLAQLGMTRIVVAHRLSTVVKADRILMIDRGRVAEEGTYQELMDRRGAFHRLAARQVL
jgi:NHLM bacteriocin system ABC transporter ATP-binding protein